MQTSRGVVLFAHKNQRTDYIELAKECARRVHLHLGVPVCLLTSEPDIEDEAFDCVIRLPRPNDKNQYVAPGETKPDAFLNQGRHLAFDLSPFTETIILDVDYLVNTDRLNLLWGRREALAVAHHAVDLEGVSLDVTLGYKSFAQVWATVVYFRRTHVTEQFFRFLDSVYTNWDFYAGSYQLSSNVFRNDYAFAIALHLLKGMTGIETPDLDIPFPIVSAVKGDRLVGMDEEYLYTEHTNKGAYSVVRSSFDLHMMNKRSILEVLHGE